MAPRLPNSSLVALSLTVVVTAMAAGGPAGTQMKAASMRTEAPSTGGSLRNAPDDGATDQPASDNAAADPAADAAPSGSTPSADDPQAEPDEGTNTIRRSRATYDSDLGEPE
jgi:hypothetical protein